MTKIHTIGIDVSKDKLSLCNTDGNMFVEFPNDIPSLEQYTIAHNICSETHRVGLESTGDYHLTSLRFFAERGIETKLINPIVTRKYTRASIRGVKTDQRDAVLIAEMVERGEGTLIRKKDLPRAKKTVLRVEHSLTEMRTQLKLLRQSLLLKTKNEIDVSSAVCEVERLIAEVTVSTQRLTKEAVQDQDRQEVIIDSIPGCGAKLSAIIATEAGDITRFASPKQFIAYAGLDPRVYQSGTKNVHGKMTKRGNPHLRRALYLAAHVARIYDPELKEFFEKKKTVEHKHHVHVTCIIARKLCERIWSTVTQDRLYEVRLPEEVKSECVDSES